MSHLDHVSEEFGHIVASICSLPFLNCKGRDKDTAHFKSVFAVIVFALTVVQWFAAITE